MKYISIVIIVLIFSCQADEKNGSSEKSEIELLNDLVRENPSEPSFYIDRANYHFENRSFQDALNDVKRSMVLDSSRADVFLLQGRLHNALQESAKAKFSFLKAIEIDEQHKESRLELAQYYGGLTNYDKALEYTNEVLRLDDQYARAYFIKGLIYRKGGVDSLAISSIQTAIELDPNTIEPFIFIGDMYGEINDPLAIEYYNSALSIDDQNQQALYSLAYFLQNNGEGRKALNTYQRILDIDSFNPIVEHNMGFVYLQVIDQADSAVIHFSNALKLNNQYYQAYYNRGVAYERLGKYEDARLDYKASLTLRHNYPLAIEGLNRMDEVLN